jgi:hypothetical protein
VQSQQAAGQGARVAGPPSKPDRLLGEAGRARQGIPLPGVVEVPGQTGHHERRERAVGVRERRRRHLEEGYALGVRPAGRRTEAMVAQGRAGERFRIAGLPGQRCGVLVVRPGGIRLARAALRVRQLEE